MRIIQSIYQVDMSWSTATSTTCQAIQLGLCTGCECSSLFVPYMDPFDFAITVHCCIYVIETIARYCIDPLSYTHLRAHETRHDLVCRLLLEKKKKTK